MDLLFIYRSPVGRKRRAPVFLWPVHLDSSPEMVPWGAPRVSFPRPLRDGRSSIAIHVNPHRRDQDGWVVINEHE